MAKSPEEMSKDILTSLRMEDAPEGILLPLYLQSCIKKHVDEAIEEYKKSITKLTPKELLLEFENYAKKKLDDIEYKPSHG